MRAHHAPPAAPARARARRRRRRVACLTGADARAARRAPGRARRDLAADALDRRHALRGASGDGEPRRSEAARAFGRFAAAARGPAGARGCTRRSPASTTRAARLPALERAIAADPAGRAAACRDEIDGAARPATARRGALRLGQRAAGSASGRSTTTPRSRNVLFDDRQRRGARVVDLDTTMPGARGARLRRPGALGRERQRRRTSATSRASGSGRRSSGRSPRGFWRASATRSRPPSARRS